MLLLGCSCRFVILAVIVLFNATDIIVWDELLLLKIISFWPAILLLFLYCFCVCCCHPFLNFWCCCFATIAVGIIVFVVIVIFIVVLAVVIIVQLSHGRRWIMQGAVLDEEVIISFWLPTLLSFINCLNLGMLSYFAPLFNLYLNAVISVAFQFHIIVCNAQCTRWALFCKD